MTRGKSAGRDSLDVNRVCPPSVRVSVESHGTSDSQQTTSVALALTIPGQIGIVTKKIQTILVQNSKLRYCLCRCDERNTTFVVTYKS